MSSGDALLELFKDAAPYLRMTEEEKLKLQTQDKISKGEKFVWVSSKSEGYEKGLVKGQKDGKFMIERLSDKKSVTMTEEEVQENSVNPAKYDKFEDMADLTYLSEGSVLYNLKERYEVFMIYTYSGLFCVTINPYKMLPVYNMYIIDAYRGKRRTEMPPHLYSIADNAYTDMLLNRENQSMLITGESGAGKTVNTKKVIQYFSLVAANKVSEADKADKKQTLEDQIVAANPAMEAFGNAKTVRNDNSSRFGKFIRIHFGPTGKLSSGDIETYLLEKSRVIFQLDGERNYHIFYQLLSNRKPELVEKCLLELDPYKYHCICQGVVDVATMDDGDEMDATQNAFEILGFSDQEIDNIYRISGSIMHMQNTKFKNKQREEQGEPDKEFKEIADKTAYLQGLNVDEMMKYLCSPRVKVGTEWVTKGQTPTQIVSSRGALAKAVFERLFNWIAKNINNALNTPLPRAYFIGCLDIAGFEIFGFNTFEQLCINFTNEKLQQFFNHHMFVLEQEEYKKEGIEWTFIDFGLDLAACIELIEKPLGIMSILEEECMFPKASDKTFKDKLFENHGKGKTPSFGKPSAKSKGQKDADFELYHYAGTVGYNVTGWLDKNKDPLNTSVVELYKKSSIPLMQTIWSDYKSIDEIIAAEKSGAGGKKKKKKSAAFMTVSALHRESLAKLMVNLRSTQPHFVRCIVPNEQKKPGMMEPHLVLHQLRCNGVLEGIRICRRGFPNRIPYGDFKQRFRILNASVVPEGSFMDPKEASEKVLKSLDVNHDKYRFGHTKVFFAAGFLGQLEEMRDAALSKIFVGMQAVIRAKLARIDFQKRLEKREAARVIQANVRSFLFVKDWEWMKIMYKIKPLLATFEAAKEMDELLEELEKVKTQLDKETKKRKELEEYNLTLLREKNDLQLNSATNEDQLADAEEKVDNLIEQKQGLEKSIAEMQERLDDEGELNMELQRKRDELEEAHTLILKDKEDLETKYNGLAEEKHAIEIIVKNLEEEQKTLEELVSKVNKEKHHLKEEHQQLLGDLQVEEDKVANLTKSRAKLEAAHNDMEEKFIESKRQATELERLKRKIEGDLRLAQEAILDLEDEKVKLEERIKKKEFDFVQLQTRLSDELSLIALLQKKIKELEARINELEEILENERSARARADKITNNAQRQLEELKERLEEAGGATNAQIEMNKKREQEILKLRRENEQEKMTHENQTNSLKKRHAEIIQDLHEQIDGFDRAKIKSDKEKAEMQEEIKDLVSNIEAITKAKLAFEKQVKNMNESQAEMKQTTEQNTRDLSEIKDQKSKLINEKADLEKMLEDREKQINALTRQRNAQAQTITELKQDLEDESKLKLSYEQAMNSSRSDVEQLKQNNEQLEDHKKETQLTLSKTNTELMQLKSKYQKDAVERVEHLENSVKDLTTRTQELDELVEKLKAKNLNLEHIKRGNQEHIKDLQIDLERMQHSAFNLERKQCTFDNTINEYKNKEEELQAEIEEADKNQKSLKTELFKVKNAFEEERENSETLKRDKLSCLDTIDDLNKQITEMTKTVHEAEKSKRTLEQENQELETQFDVVSKNLEDHESKVFRLQTDLSSLRQEFDRRIAEKDAEMDANRKNTQRIVENMQTTVNLETQTRSEAIKNLHKTRNDLIC